MPCLPCKAVAGVWLSKWQSPSGHNHYHSPYQLSSQLFLRWSLDTQILQRHQSNSGEGREIIFTDTYISLDQHLVSRLSNLAPGGFSHSSCLQFTFATRWLFLSFLISHDFLFCIHHYLSPDLNFSHLFFPPCTLTLFPPTFSMSECVNKQIKIGHTH